MLRQTLLACAILCPFSEIPGPSTAMADNPAVDIWPGEPPAWIAPEGAERDASKPDSRTIADRPVVRLGNVTRPQLVLFPAKGSETTVIVCPGGGYTILAWDLEGTEIAAWLQEHGVSAAVLKYRVPSRENEPRWKPPVQDVQRSLALIRAGAIEGMPSTNVGLLGFSAGGNASVMTATSTERHYKRVDDNDDQSLRPDFVGLIYPGYLTKEKDSEEMSDQFVITDNTPPMFFAHAFDDGHTCMGCVGLFAELKRRDIPASLHVFSTGGHGFGARDVGQETDLWLPLYRAWLKDNGWLK